MIMRPDYALKLTSAATAIDVLRLRAAALAA
jgi:hypothetical protein